MRKRSKDERLIRQEKLWRIRTDAQEYFKTRYTQAMYNPNFDTKTNQNYIEQYLEEMPIDQTGIEDVDLAEFIEYELKNYSYITPYLKNPEVEEININAWDDIKVHYANGSIVQLEDSFLNPGHAQDVIHRMLAGDGESTTTTLLDKQTPIVRSHLASNVRLTTSISPVLDDSCGIQCNIRIINPKQLIKKDFIQFGTATEEIYEFLLRCFVCGISVVFIGATGSGKTTLMSSLLRLIPRHKRLITIENQVREFNLHEYDEVTGLKVNNVIHWQSSDVISQEELLEYSLTSNPDYICLAEMKGKEAFNVTEAARTGHSVTTSMHADSCRDAYDRMTTMCQQKAINIDYDTLFSLCVKAFPIAVYVEKLDDNSRKIMEITETGLDDQRKPFFQTLYQYSITKGKVNFAAGEKIEGYFEQINSVTDTMRKRFIKRGYDDDLLDLKPQDKDAVVKSAIKSMPEVADQKHVAAPMREADPLTVRVPKKRVEPVASVKPEVKPANDVIQKPKKKPAIEAVLLPETDPQTLSVKKTAPVTSLKPEVKAPSNGDQKPKKKPSSETLKSRNVVSTTEVVLKPKSEATAKPKPPFNQNPKSNTEPITGQSARKSPFDRPMKQEDHPTANDSPVASHNKTITQGDKPQPQKRIAPIIIPEITIGEVG